MNVKLPVNGVFLIRTLSRTYKLILLGGKAQLKGHPEYCPDLTAVTNFSVGIGNVPFSCITCRLPTGRTLFTSRVLEITEVDANLQPISR